MKAIGVPAPADTVPNMAPAVPKHAQINTAQPVEQIAAI
jgi:hypothetical protein